MTETLPLVFAAHPTSGLDDQWRELSRLAGGNPHWPPIIIKATYVFGVIHDICESVEWLLKAPNAWPVTYLSAFGVCASAIEILGRCLNGDEKVSGTADLNLTRGFGWLIECTSRPELASNIVVKTNHHEYSSKELIALRHFAAHGQATVKRLDFIDIELLDTFPQLIGNGMERYWNLLQQDITMCNHLAKANIIPVGLRSAPLSKMWRFFQEEQKNVTDTFCQFNWHVNGRTSH